MTSCLLFAAGVNKRVSQTLDLGFSLCPYCRVKAGEQEVDRKVLQRRSLAKITLVPNNGNMVAFRYACYSPPDARIMIGLMSERSDMKSLKPIRTEADYEATLKEIERL